MELAPSTKESITRSILDRILNAKTEPIIFIGNDSGEVNIGVPEQIFASGNFTVLTEDSIQLAKFEVLFDDEKAEDTYIRIVIFAEEDLSLARSWARDIFNTLRFDVGIVNEVGEDFGTWAR